MTILTEIHPAPSPNIASLRLMKERAESVADDAKRLADSIRAHYAKAVLAEAFPDHAVAIFRRNWDTDQVDLDRLVDSSGVDGPHGRSSAQFTAVIEAEKQVRRMGSDDAIADHLDVVDSTEPGFVEFRLPLTDVEG